MSPIVTDGVAWSLCWSVREPSKNPLIDRDAVLGAYSGGPMEPRITWVSDPPREGAVLTGNGGPL